MADYYPLIARAVAGLPQNTNEARRALYGRARNALVAQLRGQTPTLSETTIIHERGALEDAICKAEAEAVLRSHELTRSDAISPARATNLPSRGTSTAEYATPLAAGLAKTGKVARCVSCGCFDDDGYSNYLLACGVEYSSKEKSAANQPKQWSKQVAYIWKVTLCKVCIPKSFDVQAHELRTMAFFLAKVFGVGIVCGLIAAPLIFFFGSTKVSGGTFLWIFIISVVAVLGTIVPIVSGPFVLGSIIGWRRSARRFSQNGSIKETRLFAVTKAMAQKSLERDGLTTFAELMGELSFVPSEKRNYRGKIIALAATPERLLKATTEEWKSWVKRRLAMRPVKSGVSVGAVL